MVCLPDEIWIGLQLVKELKERLEVAIDFEVMIALEVMRNELDMLRIDE